MKKRGASAAAIASHYDLGEEFFSLWLDESLTYTCADWRDPGEGLAAAQARKIDGHAAAARAGGAARVLDVGCGWGGLMRRFVTAHGVGTAVGLTLSPSQHRWVARTGPPSVEVRLEHWADHEPRQRYDAIVSVEAVEAFARNGLSEAEKVAVYREFFKRCHAWLAPGGWLSLQLIAYGNSGPEDLDPFISAEVFPESDLPRLSEVFAACERLFEVREARNDREHYVVTLETWRENLRSRREAASSVVGAPAVERFLRYLRLSRHMFESGTCDLFRIAMRRIDRPRR